MSNLNESSEYKPYGDITLEDILSDPEPTAKVSHAAPKPNKSKPPARPSEKKRPKKLSKDKEIEIVIDAELANAPPLVVITVKLKGFNNAEE